MTKRRGRRSGVFVGCVMIVLGLSGCGVKDAQLPYLTALHVGELEFCREVRNENGKARREYFKDDWITSPFYYYLRLNHIKDKGVMKIVFYRDENKKVEKVEENVFYFGKTGEHYEYIIFFDRIEKLVEGKHRYAIFVNERLIYDGVLRVRKAKEPGK